MRELESLRAECERAERTLRSAPPEAWSGPGLGDWDLHELAVHLTRGMARIATYLDKPVEGAVTKDRISYFRYDPAEVSAAVAERARREAEALPPERVADAFADAWRDSVQRASGLPPDRPIATIFGPMRLDEYTATRVLEAVVHHMDLRRALDLPPDPDPAAAEMVVGILEELLDGPRPRNLGRDRFILVGTGRLPHDDPRFPLLG